MAKSDLEKYIRDPRMTMDIPHPEVTQPRLALPSEPGGWGDRAFRMTWWPITEPFEMIHDHHAHDFDQFIMFVGGDITNMMDLGGRGRTLAERRWQEPGEVHLHHSHLRLGAGRSLPLPSQLHEDRRPLQTHPVP